MGRVTAFVSESLLFPSLSARKKMALRYLRGAGIEIGALQHPLELAPGVIVRYLDTVSREENIRRYPHLDPSRIVVTDLMDDGFAPTSLPPASQEFIIANHLLEHAPNPLQVLLNWNRLLKRGGILFLTLPDGSRNFDRGRRITPLEHLVEDFELVKSGDLEQFARNNREHYREFVEISIPNLNRMRGRRPMTPERQREYLEELVAQQSTDPHFHVFNRESMIVLCRHLTAVLAPELALKETVRSRFGREQLLIFEKRGE